VDGCIEERVELLLVGVCTTYITLLQLKVIDSFDKTLFAVYNQLLYHIMADIPTVIVLSDLNQLIHTPLVLALI